MADGGQPVTDSYDERERVAALSILNFYERMAISLRFSIFDEEMWYDDKGLVLVLFSKWVEELRRHNDAVS